MQQQQGGSQYGVPPPPPDMTPFSSPRAHMLGISNPDPLQQQAPPPQTQLAEAASPISSRPPPPGTGPRPPSSNFEELVPAVPGNFPDDEALVAAGEEVERGGATGNRWPRQETLALLKIRSEMDAAFRDATLKGPLWEDVSRRLAELGYRRSAKKCKEKFENVHKYYKRTKEGRAGRQDGKSYRFFSQLEALHSSSSSSAAAAAPGLTTATAAAPTTPIGISTGIAGPSSARIQPPPVSAVAPPPIAMPTRVGAELTPATGVAPPGISGSAATAAAAAGISFSSNTSSSSSSESDDEETVEAGGSREGRKRKRSGSGGSRKMMAFFEGLMKQVMERQETMQQRFLETVEKREQDRMIREEAWRRQEMARLNHEHELLAQERAMAASRDAAIISCIQKISGQTIPLPTVPATAVHASSVAPPPAPPQQQSQQPQPQHQQQQRPPAPMQPSQQQQELHQHHQSTEIGRHQVSSSSELVPVPEQQEPVGTVNFEPASPSRWPKAEVHALIKLRSGLDSRYQEAGPKGPLWEEISAGMQRLGYNRSSKRCKEKWENINKYFKKVKESNRKRPEDSKTCPYFHQLDALYRKKHLGSGGSGSNSGGGIQRHREQQTDPDPNPQERSELPITMAPPQAPPPPPPPQQPSAETETKNGSNNNNNGGGGGGGGGRNGTNSEGGGGSGAVQIQTSNGGLPPSFFEEGSSAGGMTMKKPEDIVKELMDQRQQQPTMEDYDKMEEPDSDNIDQDDDEDDDEDDEDGKMQYKIQFQRPNVGGGGGTTSTAAPTAGSFLAMVQ